MYWVGRKEKDVQWERGQNMGPSWIKSEKETEKWRFCVLWNVDIYTNLFASTYSHKHAHVFYTNDWCLSSCVLVPFRFRTFCCRVINMILNNILQRWTYSSGTDDYSTRPKQQQQKMAHENDGFLTHGNVIIGRRTFVFSDSMLIK